MLNVLRILFLMALLGLMQVSYLLTCWILHTMHVWLKRFKKRAVVELHFLEGKGMRLIFIVVASSYVIKQKEVAVFRFFYKRHRVVTCLDGNIHHGFSYFPSTLSFGFCCMGGWQIYGMIGGVELRAVSKISSGGWIVFISSTEGTSRGT